MLGLCPRQLNGQAHDSKWFFLRCHCHTQVPCVFSWLRLALLIFQNSEGCTPSPSLHPFFSAKVKAGKTTHVFLSPSSRRSWLPLDEPSSTSASVGISPGTMAGRIWRTGGTHNGKQVFMATQVETARRRCLPCLSSKLLAGELEFWARKCWEKLRVSVKEGGKDHGGPEVLSLWTEWEERKGAR